MNVYLKKFIKKNFSEPGTALDLGAGDFFDVTCLKQLGWKCDGVDLKTGVNLEKSYVSKKLYDLVYCNYVLHKLENKKQLIETIFNNLKNNGWFFIHTFDVSDKNSFSDISKESLRELLTNQGFGEVNISTFDFYDNDIGHKHWHKILEATGQQRS